MAKTAKIEVREQDPVASLQGFLKMLLSVGGIDGVLVAQHLPGKSVVMPTLVVDPEKLNNADPLAPAFPINAARIVSKLTRKPLDEQVAAMQGVTSLRHDAFTLKPGDIGQVDWLCSDVVCYPKALFEWVSGWLESGLARNFVCTIKMQGKNFDKEITDRFAAIPGSRVIHLWHNKHELTWIRTSRE